MTVTAILNQYRENAIFSAPPSKLVIMLYDGALKHLNASVTYLEQNDRALFGAHLGKANGIVVELLSSLDHDVAEDISRNLEKLYLFVIDRITQANISLDPAGLKDSIRILTTLREGWEYAASHAQG